MWKKLIETAFTGLTETVEKAVKDIEEAGNAVNESGIIVLRGQEKHKIVADSIIDIVVVKINEKVDIPWINEETEEKLFRGLLRLAVDYLIKKAVKNFNLNGWS